MIDTTEPRERTRAAAWANTENKNLIGKPPQKISSNILLKESEQN